MYIYVCVCVCMCLYVCVTHHHHHTPPPPQHFQVRTSGSIMSTVSITRITTKFEDEYYTFVNDQGSTVFIDNILASDWAFRSPYSHQDNTAKFYNMWYRVEAKYAGKRLRDLEVGMHPYLRAWNVLTAKMKKAGKTLNKANWMAYANAKIADGLQPTHDEWLNAEMSFFA